MTKEEKEMAREIGARVFCNKNSVSRKICQNWGRNRGRGDGGEKKAKKKKKQWRVTWRAETKTPFSHLEFHRLIRICLIFLLSKQNKG
jgi:hypothetical protein